MVNVFYQQVPASSIKLDFAMVAFRLPPSDPVVRRHFERSDFSLRLVPGTYACILRGRPLIGLTGTAQHRQNLRNGDRRIKDVAQDQKMQEAHHNSLQCAFTSREVRLRG